eukprot:403332791
MEDPLKLLKQKRGSLQQISKNSAVRSRKNSLQGQQNSSSQTRQNKNAKDSMAQFVQSTKSGSFHAGANGNLSSQKSALRDLSSQRSNGNNATHDENHTPPRPKKLGGKKKKTLESRNQQISIHNNNKPPLLLLQTLKNEHKSSIKGVFAIKSAIIAVIKPIASTLSLTPTNQHTNSHHYIYSSYSLANSVRIRVSSHSTQKLLDLLKNQQLYAQHASKRLDNARLLSQQQ